MGRGQKAAAAAAAAASAAASVGTPGTAASSVASELQTLLLPAAVATIAVVLSCVQGMLHVNTVRYANHLITLAYAIADREFACKI